MSIESERTGAIADLFKSQDAELYERLWSILGDDVDRFNAVVVIVKAELAKAKLEARRDTGLVDANGESVNLGDKLHLFYVTPLGEMTDTLGDEYYSLGTVTFEIGAYCLRTEASPDPIPLHKFLKKKQGEYVSNYGNSTIYSNVLNAQLDREIKEANSHFAAGNKKEIQDADQS